ncbi:LysR family transcriptional regulator [Gilliamella sp. App6-5]|uniref:LysR family transcriptional regulator n=1 Tax=Gilliamella sp. App6-5 TaxID=3120232 RepID=UPI00080E7DB5|nr:LysR family transcriptional regulator [Gilliamella apicola]OCG13509.1 LysR family transcriptional regulator [Gilliamella apicola]
MNRSNKLLEMTVFVTVVDCNSFVEAANKLNMSKQAVSRCIQSLEDRLQVRLLQRTTRKMVITYEGQTFYLQAKAIINATIEAENAISMNKVSPQGMLRINVPVSFGILYLAPLWQKFIDKYPNIELDITLSDRVVDLLEEGYDLAVRISRLENSSLISRKLATTQIIAAASPDYVAKYGMPNHPDELLNHKIIMYSQWAKKEQWHFYKDNTYDSVNLKANIYCNNGDTCRQIMLQNGGISLQPDFIIGQDIKMKRLVRVLLDYNVEDLNIYAIYPSRKLLPLRTRCLIDFLIGELKYYRRLVC